MKKQNVALLFVLPFIPVAAIYLPKWDRRVAPFVYKAPVVHKTTVLTLPADPKKKIEYVPDNEDTRVDIVMKSDTAGTRSTLKVSTFYLLDGRGRKYSSFKTSDGGVRGITFGWDRSVGQNLNAYGFAFPLTQIPASAGKITFKVIFVDEHNNTIPVSVAVRK